MLDVRKIGKAVIPAHVIVVSIGRVLPRMYNLHAVVHRLHNLHSVKVVYATAGGYSMLECHCMSTTPYRVRTTDSNLYPLSSSVQNAALVLLRTITTQTSQPSQYSTILTFSNRSFGNSSLFTKPNCSTSPQKNMALSCAYPK